MFCHRAFRPGSWNLISTTCCSTNPFTAATHVFLILSFALAQVISRRDVIFWPRISTRFSFHSARFFVTLIPLRCMLRRMLRSITACLKVFFYLTLAPIKYRNPLGLFLDHRFLCWIVSLSLKQCGLFNYTMSRLGYLSGCFYHLFFVKPYED